MDAGCMPSFYMQKWELWNVWPKMIGFGILCTGVSVSNIQMITLTGMPGMPCDRSPHFQLRGASYDPLSASLAIFAAD